MQTYDGPFQVTGDGDHASSTSPPTTPRSPTSSRRRRSACGSTARRPRRGIDARPAGGRRRTGRRSRSTRRTARRLRRRAHAVPRRRRPVEGLRGRGRADLRRHGRLARAVGPGRRRRSSCSTTARAASRRLERSLGMLWYPVKPYGDFRLKFQFREGRDRRRAVQRRRVRPLPGPAHAARRAPDACAPDGQRGQRPGVGRDLLRPRDPALRRQTGEEQKTGSIYNFDRNDTRRHRDPSRRRRVERLRDRGRRPAYRIFRNGELIKEFENAPGQARPARGDPPTSQRQFAQGFIGLQNHGGRRPDAVPRHPRRGPLAGRARAQTRPGRSRSRAPARTRSRSARSTPRATSRRSRRSTSRSARSRRRPGEPPRRLPPVTDTPATFRLGASPRASARSASPSRGLTVRVACTGAMSGTAPLQVSHSARRAASRPAGARWASRSVRCYGAHTATVRLKPSKALMRKLAAGAARQRHGPSSTLTVKMADLGKPDADAEEDAHDPPLAPGCTRRGGPAARRPSVVQATRVSPASAQPCSSASRPNASSGPAAPVAAGAPCGGAAGGPGQACPP